MSAEKKLTVTEKSVSNFTTVFIMASLKSPDIQNNLKPCINITPSQTKNVFIPSCLLLTSLCFNHSMITVL